MNVGLTRLIASSHKSNFPAMLAGYITLCTYSCLIIHLTHSCWSGCLSIRFSFV